MVESRAMSKPLPLRILLPLAGTLLVVLLDACGGAANNAAHTASVPVPPASLTQTTSATATAPHTVSTATATTTTTTTAQRTGQSQRCSASNLAARFLGGQGATGHGVLGFALRNTGATPCHTYGYPGIQFLNASGAALPTQTTRTTSDFFGSTKLAPLTLAPGASASFRLGVTHVPAGSASCQTAAVVQVIPPDETVALKVPLPAGGSYECGTATVSPLQAGTQAYPG